jgi:hypothetical protein
MATTAAPVLDLLTDTQRPTVRVDGTLYALRTSRDLTLEAYKTLEPIPGRLGALMVQPSLSDVDSAELSRLLDQTCRLVLMAPDDVQARLGEVNRSLIAKVFFELLTPSLLRARATLGMEAHRSAGTSSSRGSNGSTAARQRRGSATPRSGSSART